MSKVSVIIPTYNRETEILRAIESVQHQTYDNLEIVIIDDASTDNTQEVVHALSDQRIRYFKLNENSGGATARNKGIELAEGEYVTFLDSDDEWMPDMLEKSSNYYHSQSKKRVVIFSQIIMDNKRTKKVYPMVIYNTGDLSEYIFNQKGLVHTITLFMPKSVASEIMFKPSLRKHQDYDFVLRAYKAGVQFKMIDEALAIWHCEPREDRMGQRSEYEYSYKWLINNKNLFTNKSFKKFIYRDILRQVVSHKYSLNAFFFLVKLEKKSLITRSVLFKSIAKLLLSNPLK